MVLAFFILYLCQMPVDPVRSGDVARLLREAHLASADQAKAEYARRKNQEFKQRFTELAKTVREFAEAYNETQGQVWPRKQADALQKAMEALQRSKGWTDWKERKVEAQ